jgi:Mce-associated membrane protein
MRNRAPILLGIVIALLLGGVAVWFGLESHRVSRDADRLAAETGPLVAKAKARGGDGVDVDNKALTDPARTSEVINTVRPMVEKVLSYDYRNLDSSGVKENLSGKALCEYERLFGEVVKTAPEQHVVLTSKVREIGVSRLVGEQATVLVFVDQNTTRDGQGQATASGAQLAFQVERHSGRWKITNFDLLSQALADGTTGFQC